MCDAILGIASPSYFTPLLLHPFFPDRPFLLQMAYLVEGNMEPTLAISLNTPLLSTYFPVRA